MKAVHSKGEETRDRIIAAAGTVFAERGFRGTTIRQITARAGVNLAAVHYHFRDKGDLYVRVLWEAKKHLSLISIQEMPGMPEEKLHAFVRRFMHYLLDPQRPLWHGRVLAMEMSNPTPALNVIIRELTAPVFQDVRDLIAQMVDRAASPTELDLLAMSVFGQCVFYACGRPVVEKLAVHLGQESDRVERIANHIGSFSVAALKIFCPSKPKRSRLPRRSPSLVLS